ncbi:MAG: M48 family metallopeptidase [Burkholderiaceae bacterium]|jgi:predicted metal-dependent hydrolase|nr:M48 family metallopeptidase [Burkholderiaceae bacterium]
MLGLLRYTLDLFDPRPPARHASPAPKKPGSRKIAPPPVSLVETLSPRPPAQPLERAHFVHPRATREVWFGQARVAYEFTRTRRRSIGFVVGDEGLSVRAPRWVALREIDAALQEKSTWILRKFEEVQQRRTHLDAVRIIWRDGVQVPYLGGPMQVRLDPAHRFASRGGALEQRPGQPPCLHLALASDAPPEHIRDAVQAWLMRSARMLFTERMNHYAPRLGVQWRKLSLSSAQTRWGSASSNGAIRLNWRLIHFTLPVIDYVVAHELAHLHVMDHSPRFWATVAQVIPEHARLRRALKEHPLPRWV